MTETLNIGVIGLGVMGRRMLDRLSAHPRLRACLVWDANPAAVAQALQAHPHLQAATDAAALIGHAGLHSLYIATPPAPHMALSELAFDAGLAVFCEKPLTVDFAAARACIQRIEQQGQRAAVNFALASAPGLALLEQAFGQASSAAELGFGALDEVQLNVAFAAWPRPWQAAAGSWLSERREGGFTREVLSHFIFVLQRVLGPATVTRSAVSYPADGVGAETDLQAELQAAGCKVSINARVGGNIADDNRMLWRAAQGEIELSTWFSQIRQQGGSSAHDGGDTDSLRALAQTDQLDQWAALIEGRPHSLPGYAEALAVQETIEALLLGR